MQSPSQPPAIAIVVSRYNDSITGPMLLGAIDALQHRWPGATPAVLRAPGAFELVAMSSAALRTGAFEAVVALGCVIKGETSHDQHINDAVAGGLASLAAETGVPVCFGVITAGNDQQARDRAGGSKGNKGAETMQAALETIDELRRLRTAAMQNRPEMLAPASMPPLAGSADKTKSAQMAGSNGAHGLHDKGSA
ncbi:MAG: 6,7-dimethyl-8-ribityllumazine synthase [Phycisphaerales bacterium]|mgnify:CR=1 FL=1|nr:6,7-dimethyl-8-ribityllumazine synthase [Phycisphaerales bacterium]